MNFEESLNQQNTLKQLYSIFKESYDGLWMCDGEGKVILVNHASEKINSINANQVIGKRMSQLIQDGLIDRSVTLEVLKHQTTITIIQKLRNGKEILVTGNPVFDDKGNIALVVVNERDITELNKVRRELEESRAFFNQNYLSEFFMAYKNENIPSHIVFRSQEMLRIFNLAKKAADVDSTVLIWGESGVGKGVFAKFIHQTSKRKKFPFIRVSCGTIPESLIESELFGYEKGAFTGANTKGKPGHLELAEGGTLFLDEIGDLPLNMQIKILRFLEENEVIRLGGTTPKKINTRIIAATHQNIEEMMAKGEFREDLFYRLNVIPINIIPLRERRDDIPQLIDFFLKRFNQKCSKNKVIFPGAVDCICDYSFPGNIRELANLIERMVVLTPGDHIRTEDLPLYVRAERSQKSNSSLYNQLNLNKEVAKLEKAIIIRALKIYGSQRKAAKPLGIDQSTLARKAKRYGIYNDAIIHNNDIFHKHYN